MTTISSAIEHLWPNVQRELLVPIKREIFDSEPETEWIQAYQARCVSAARMSAFGAQRAIGYEMDVIEKKVLSDGKVIPYKVRKHYPPDVTACIFWLKNRNPKQWRDVQDHVHDSRLDKLTSEELLEEIRADAVKLGIIPEKYGGRRRTKRNGDDTTRH